MERQSLKVPILLNDGCYARTLVDTGSEVYGMIDERFAAKCKLPRIEITPRTVDGIGAPTNWKIDQVTYAELDIGGHKQRQAYFYIVPRLSGYEIILGTPWLVRERVLLDPSSKTLQYKDTGLVVKQEEDLPRIDSRMVGASAFMWLTQKQRKHNCNVFSASMADINKALSDKKPIDPSTKLPSWVDRKFLKLFSRDEANKLPPHRDGIDHKIELEKDQNGRTPEAPWGPLYNMSRDELLVLRKTLNELLDKGFIRVSNSPAAAPVLFVKKPGGGLRFCCDYRALNRISRKDRYPLPLIQETLNRISKARWFTKLDVISAFHKIRVAKGDEWLTAFRTRFGLFEWLVTPFGLANAPSTFQRYVNWVLRDYLDEFVSAYVDDILIFTEGTQKQHREQVQLILGKLLDAGLQIDITKCDFEVQTTKYLGFIIEAGRGIRMDPAKVSAIMDWETPTTVKGVMGFLGFANFYRRFIKGFSSLVAPLHALTRKDARFEWSDAADTAFEKLKKAFITAPILAQFDPDRQTVLETDSSGYCVGGILSQYDNNGLLRPVAYYSKRNLPAECNYEIYDKELLAIVKCLREWDAELRSVCEFKIITDHKNLEYFTTTRKLTERQIRWWQELSRFAFRIEYRPGKKNVLADALSRREQDLPISLEDDRLQHRVGQILSKEADGIRTNRNHSALQEGAQSPTPMVPHAMPAHSTTQSGGQQPSQEQTNHTQRVPAVLNNNEIQQLWRDALQQDTDYERLSQAVREGRRTFPADLTVPVKVSISDCSMDNQGALLFRKRHWVPNCEPLRTKIIQAMHDSTLTAHPGRTGTVQIVGRHFFWPNFITDIRRFCRNCDVCGRTKIWRDRKQGMLRPLPIPSRQWREISIDFVGPLPISRKCEMLMVITDRLSKGVILEACENLEAGYIARLFLKCFYRRHGIPTAIVSDRGSQFVSHVWGRLCELLRIERRLSTAYHPETDGSTERANAEVETLLRQMVNHAQNDWVDWLPVVEFAINGKDSSTTGTSPFFLSHGYHVEPLQLSEELQQPSESDASSPLLQADAIVTKIKATTEWVQSAMAEVQQEQERLANRHRSPSPAYKVGDKVWLNLKNVRTDRPSKKLDDRSAKFTITEVVGPHSYRLDIPGRVHNVFNVDLLRPAGLDPLPSQVQDDYQPPPIQVDGEDRWLIETILDEKIGRRGRQRRNQKFYLVKWEGYANPTWEPASALRGTESLKVYIQTKKKMREEGG